MSTTSDAVTSIVHYTKNVRGNLRAHVLAKRTYRLSEGRLPDVAPEQLTVVRESLHYDGDEDNPVEWEPDIFACPRESTDIVVQGSAYSLRGPRRELEVSVTVQLAGMTHELAKRTARRIRVFGDRRVQGAAGSISFSVPEPFETMPLTYRRAYGGRDRVADAEQPDDFAAWIAKAAESPIEDFSPYEYPRNPMGTGYVVYPNPRALDGLILPNLEMPGDLLTPERLVLGSHERWPWAPHPAGFDWTDQDWFPRAAFMGLSPSFEGKAEDVPEVRDGQVPAKLLEGDFLDHMGAEEAPRFFHGAAPWLILPDFSGGEVIWIEHMHPSRAIVEVPMPRERPQMVIELYGGAPAELEPALRTVVIRPDKEQLVCVWVGTVPVDRRPTEAQLQKTRHAVRWRR